MTTKRPIDVKHLLKHHAYVNTPLNFEEAFAVGVMAVDGCKGDEMAARQSVAVLCALHNQATYGYKYDPAKEAEHDHSLPKSAGEQIAGICAAVFSHDILRSRSGFISPKLPNDMPFVMDNCGMGGDMIVTPNVSTTAAFIAASYGIPMCKHGSPSNADKGRHGSSDFISLLGIDTMVVARRTKECLEDLGFAYTEALDTQYKGIHLQTHEFAMLPHMNDIIGPITNPIHPHLLKRRVLGVNHLMSPRVVAEAYQILNERGVTKLEHGLFVRGFVDKEHAQGMDEVSICEGGTMVAELKDGVITEYRLQAEDFGLTPVRVEDISPPENLGKGRFSLEILKRNVNGPALQMVLANAATLFYVAGVSTDLKECYRFVEREHASGRPYELARKVAERLPAPHQMKEAASRA